MSVTPEKDPNYIYAHPYATLIADEYRMRGGYCIVRPGGTDDHLMLLTRAGRGLFRTPRGDAVPLAAGSLAVLRPYSCTFASSLAISFNCQPSATRQACSRPIKVKRSPESAEASSYRPIKSAAETMASK